MVAARVRRSVNGDKRPNASILMRSAVRSEVLSSLLEHNVWLAMNWQTEKVSLLGVRWRFERLGEKLVVHSKPFAMLLDLEYCLADYPSPTRLGPVAPSEQYMPCGSGRSCDFTVTRFLPWLRRGWQFRIWFAQDI
jgi:hypothetical protein